MTADPDYWRLEAITYPDWHRLAACAGTDPEAFFPEKGEHANLARQICETCPVSNQCLQDALKYGRIEGIWAGTNERERRGMQRNVSTAKQPSTHRQTCGTILGYKHHIRHYEQTCADCRKAWADFKRNIGRRNGETA